MTWMRSASQTSRSKRTLLNVQSLDERAMPAALNSCGPCAPGANDTAIVYTETNNPQDGLNAVLAFRRDAATGDLTRLGSYATGGTGQINVPKIVGPDDGDQEVQASADGKFVYAVNEGSDNISAFRILGKGSLQLIGTFSSGGDQPDSIGLAGNILYVANRGDASQGHPGTTTPNVTAFNINRDGTITLIPGSAVNFPVGTFVTQTLVSPDKRFLFVEAATLAGVPGGNTVSTFRIHPDGTLTAAPGGPASAGDKAPVLLGAASHPTLNIIYTGFASSSQVGVFSYDETGGTNYVAPVADTGAAPCWCVVSKDGRTLYVSNTATDSVTVFSLADPLNPVQIQELPLGGPRGTAGGPRTNSFEIALDPTGRYLFAITQSTDPAFPQGNQLHTLRIARDGTVSEPLAPVIFSPADVPANAHAQGLAIVQIQNTSSGHAQVGPIFGGLSDPSIGDDGTPTRLKDVIRSFRGARRFGPRH
ncbi:lactonase family protein [Zavarzinella formosa]|uniref:lactonase family protein n=1 Tax=Zavarzinella formosa TaxID=360055 RepID=UPI00030A9F37|nr:beta-propeller fold lactonase family protein [Zavarzinella formosa]